MKKTFKDYQPEKENTNVALLIIACALFIGLVFAVIWAVFTENINNKQDAIIETQKEVFTLQLKQCQAERDTLLWCREIGIRTESNN